MTTLKTLTFFLVMKKKMNMKRTEKKGGTKRHVKNVLSFYSGHYESYGLNCQAAAKQG